MSATDQLVELRISTRNPSKWIAVDLETGEFWRPDISSSTLVAGWRRATPEQLAALRANVSAELFDSFIRVTSALAELADDANAADTERHAAALREARSVLRVVCGLTVSS